MNLTAKVEVNEDNEKYLSAFSEYRIIPFDFFLLFFGKLWELERKSIKRDFSQFFFVLKKNDKYSNLMESIKFRNNGINVYSNQIEESIYLLQTSDFLGKKNPSFGEILIEYDDDSIKQIKEKFEKADLTLMDELVADFLKLYDASNP